MRAGSDRDSDEGVLRRASAQLTQRLRLRDRLLVLVSIATMLPMVAPPNVIAAHAVQTPQVVESILASAPPATPTTDAITVDDVNALAPSAEAFWPGETFAGVTYVIADLAADQLAEAIGLTITIDPTGADHGWFVDSSAGADEEFTDAGGYLTATVAGPAEGKMDLLTVLAHELGHVAGQLDIDPAVDAHDLMTGSIDAGERRAP